MIYFVPTPIGNLQDITLRAINLLSSCPIIITEDGKVASKLLKLLNINPTPKPRFINITQNHRFNMATIQRVVQESQENNTEIAVVSDAGTPGLSDPGFELIKLLQNQKIDYTILPGATALIPAVVASGLISKDFLYLGFLPIKKGRQSQWQEIALSSRPVVIYESVHRIKKLMLECKKYLHSSRKIAVIREISKSFEQYWFGIVEDLENQEWILKGEFVVIIDKN